MYKWKYIWIFFYWLNQNTAYHSYQFMHSRLIQIQICEVNFQFRAILNENNNFNNKHILSFLFLKNIFHLFNSNNESTTFFLYLHLIIKDIFARSTCEYITYVYIYICTICTPMYLCMYIYALVCIAKYNDGHGHTLIHIRHSTLQAVPLPAM